MECALHCHLCYGLSSCCQLARRINSRSTTLLAMMAGSVVSAPALIKRRAQPTRTAGRAVPNQLVAPRARSLRRARAPLAATAAAPAVARQLPRALLEWALAALPLVVLLLVVLLLVVLLLVVLLLVVLLLVVLLLVVLLAAVLLLVVLLAAVLLAAALPQVARALAVEAPSTRAPARIGRPPPPSPA